MPRFVKPNRSAAIGARICIARVTAGLSRPEVGRGLGMSPQMMERYERGFARLPAVMLVDLARLLGREPGFFLATDDTALARAQLLELPEDKVLCRQAHRAIDALRSSAAEPALVALGGAPRSPTDERLSA